MEFACPSCGAAVGVLAVREGKATCPSCSGSFRPSVFEPQDQTQPAPVESAPAQPASEDEEEGAKAGDSKSPDSAAQEVPEAEKVASVSPSDRTEALTSPASRRGRTPSNRATGFVEVSSSARLKRVSKRLVTDQLIPALERAGPYEVVGEVARGGMGIVFKARDRHLRRLVAIKVLRGDSGDPDEVLRFRREAEAAAKLQHSNIVPIHAVGDIDGRPFFVMDFIEGRGLNDLIKAGELSPRAALDIAEQTAEALHYAHLQGVVHRDLKPANIIVDRIGRPQVMDFGLAKQIDDDQSLTKTGTTMGTPAYMPPEQAEGDLKSIDESSDVYSLGAVLYEMLTGQPPFTGSSTMNVLMKVLEDEPEAPRRINPRIHKDIETICLKAMSKDKPQRYQSAQQLADDVRRFRAGEAISAAPASVIYRLRKWFSRTWQLAAATAAIVLVFAGLTTYVLVTDWQYKNHLKSAEDEQIRGLMDGVISHLLVFRKIRASGKESWRKDARKVLASAEDDTLMVLARRPDHEEATSRLKEVRALIAELREMDFLELADGFLDQEQFVAAQKLYSIVLEDYNPRSKRAKEGVLLAKGVGHVWISTTPEGVEVLLNDVEDERTTLGTRFGTTPVSDAKVPIGDYRVTLQSAGVGRHELPLHVDRAGEVRFNNILLPQKGGAGSEMVLVPAGQLVLPGGRTVRLDAFAIDRYESGAGLGEIPSHGLSWVESSAACKKRAKRLCSFHEWRRACSGDSGLAFPYGSSFDPNRCWTAGGDEPGAAGGKRGCVSPWGVYDMSGNVMEWVGPVEAEAVLYGGHWSLNEGAFLGCHSDHPASPSEKPSRAGYRCCSGAGADALAGQQRGVTPSLAGVVVERDEPKPLKFCPSDMVKVDEGKFPFDTGFGETRNVSIQAFCIDRYEYPGRAGSVPKTDVTWIEASRLCRERGRRLCSPAEWQHACGGPMNLDFPYGNRYRSTECHTDRKNEKPEASGTRLTCKSGFGAQDMSGNVAEWLAPAESEGPFEIAGGSLSSTRFESRCAFRLTEPSGNRSGEVGFRCCANLE